MNFSPQASSHVVVAALNVIQSPESVMGAYWQLRHDLYIHPPIDTGIQGVYRNKRFHAANDPQVVRNRVFEIICENLESLAVHVLVLEKSRVHEHLRTDSWLYEKLYYFTTKSILTRSTWATGAQGVRQLIDHTEDNRLRKDSVRGIRKAEAEVEAKSRSEIYHTTSFAHPFLQLADYFCWAVYRKYENDDDRSYRLIEKAIENEWRLFGKDDPPG